MSINFKTIPFIGGLNTTAPSVTIPAGMLLDCMNYECLQEGGYQRIQGYQLCNGSDTPDAVPGVGPILGLHIYKDALYAVRDDVNGVGRLYKTTVTGWEEVDGAVTWTGGGRYEFANYNFFGQDEQEEMFIVNGKDKAKKYDGTAFVDLTTGLTEDKPSSVIGFKFHLVLGIESSLMISSVGDPTNWDAATGSASEIAVGDTITTLEVSQGALIIGCRKGTQILYGNDASDFRLEPTNKTGTYRHTMQNVGGQIIGIDDAGVMSLQASNAFGNFVYASISDAIRNQMRTLIDQGDLRTAVNRAKGQYRVFSGRNGLIFSFTGQQLLGITKLYFDHPVRSITNGDIAGEERSFFGDDEGNVYQLDTSYTFNGEKIYSHMLTAFHHYGLPTQQKRFRQISFDMRVQGERPTIYVLPITDFGGGFSTDAINTTNFEGMRTGGGLWDFSLWDELVWDELYGYMGKVRVNSVGSNMGIMISSDGSEGNHVIYAATVHYSPRRLKR